MKEITREINARMTLIETMTDEDTEDIEKAREDAEKNVTRDLERIYKPDDITVEIKDFIRTIPRDTNWIPIEDDYPPEHTDVLVSIQGAMAIGQHFNKQFTVYGRQDTEVEAWRFLPEGYQPGGGEYYI